MFTFTTMKKILILFSLVLAAVFSHAQTKPNIDNIPPYRILRTDSVYVTPASLKKNKPVVIIYFAPDCGHCQHLMYEMKPKMKEFGDAQIVMITFTDFTMLKAIQVFYNDFGLSRYPNITVGTEGHTYIVQRYYQVETTPYIAVYDRKGKLVKAFEKAPAIDDLIAAVKKG